MSKLLILLLIIGVSACTNIQSRPTRYALPNSPNSDSLPPSPHSVDEDEYLDASTGLIWRRCPLGTEWQSQKCEGWPKGTTYFGAVAYASGEARRTGRYWRLPRAQELRALYDSTQDSRQIFPRMPGPMSYWSMDKSTGWYAYYVKFFETPDGKPVDEAYNMKLHGVMLVRSQ